MFFEASIDRQLRVRFTGMLLLKSKRRKALAWVGTGDGRKIGMSGGYKIGIGGNYEIGKGDAMMNRHEHGTSGFPRKKRAPIFPIVFRPRPQRFLREKPHRASAASFENLRSSMRKWVPSFHSLFLLRCGAPDYGGRAARGHISLTFCFLSFIHNELGLTALHCARVARVNAIHALSPPCAAQSSARKILTR
jgi:hypothetical protein